MNEYLKVLKQEFFNSTGIIVDFETKMNIKEFTYWLEIRQKIGNEYLSLLDNLGLEYQSNECAETDKGSLDSLVKPFETTIITPYTRFENVSPNRIIKGSMEAYQGVPLKRNIKNGLVNYERIESYFINTFMTQNPYSFERLKGWDSLHKSNKYNIICGVYGTLYDDDIQKKINNLKRLKNIIEEDYVESYETHNNNYFYVIGSKRKIKERIK